MKKTKDKMIIVAEISINHFINEQVVCIEDGIETHYHDVADVIMDMLKILSSGMEIVVRKIKMSEKEFNRKDNWGGWKK